MWPCGRRHITEVWGFESLEICAIFKFARSASRLWFKLRVLSLPPLLQCLPAATGDTKSWNICTETLPWLALLVLFHCSNRKTSSHFYLTWVIRRHSWAYILSVWCCIQGYGWRPRIPLAPGSFPSAGKAWMVHWVEPNSIFWFWVACHSVQDIPA